MSQALLLSIVLISIGPSLQQLQNLKDPEFVAAGRTVTISCRYDGGNLGDGNHPWWAQQIPGNKPQALIYATSTRPSGIPERFSGSRSGNVMSLTITGALVEDEATYYCCVWTGSQLHSDSFRCGSETKTLLFISFPLFCFCPGCISER
uniref:Ig-like domain-containing protein n=1 Tax=Naja naja TaxID=35670 RepID=A0A8C6XFW3_NAJNA